MGLGHFSVANSVTHTSVDTSAVLWVAHGCALDQIQGIALTLHKPSWPLEGTVTSVGISLH